MIANQCDDFAEHARQLEYVVEMFDILDFTINVDKSVMLPALSRQI